MRPRLKTSGREKEKAKVRSRDGRVEEKEKTVRMK
jgi:hypothetical protein